jgi:hypothetical protein
MTVVPPPPPTLLSRFSVVRLLSFPKTQDGRRERDLMIQEKSRDALDEFQTNASNGSTIIGLAVYIFKYAILRGTILG